MEKQVVQTDNAPKAIGPYSQAIRIGDLIYTAGQVALSPTTGELVGTDIEAQTRQVLENLKGVLEAAGSSFDNVVKTTVFLASIGDFAKMNAIYSEYFTGKPPARSTVQVSALPKNALVEIECVAIGNG
jgi:2-iminobutanoate/2-iminopropanoate deaminase